MLTPASFAAPAAATTGATTSSFSGYADVLSAVEDVRRARLPCRRIPGPPLTSAATAAAAAAADASDGVSGAGTEFQAALHASPTTIATSPASASREGTTAAASAAHASKAETTLQAAQHFLATSGASLLHFANASLSLAARDAVGDRQGEECGVLAEENLLASAPAMEVLKERYNSNSNSSSSSSSAAGVEWKKLVYVRQQCRYTGKALVDASRTSAAGLAHSTVVPSPAVSSTNAAAADAELSTGARFMQSLLHPFVPPAVKKGPTADGACEVHAVVPHGAGVMVYVLYAMPKADYNPTATAAPTTTVSALPAPFLPPSLIPTAVCPPLSELGVEAQTSTTPGPSRLLLLSLVVYEGSFEEGRRHGRGRLTAYGRFVLECTWTHDVPCLTVPRLPLASAHDEAPHAQAPSPPPPTLRCIHAHLSSSSPATAPNPAAAAASPSPSWSLQTRQRYMGGLALTAPASKRLLARFDSTSSVTTSASSSSAAVVETFSGRYVRLTVPDPPFTAAAAAADSAFTGLAWVNHVVFLPDGFGEAHHYPASTALSASDIFCSPSSVFHPPLWVPRNALGTRVATHLSLSSSASSLCTQYCGEWSAGLPHGFGVELQRVTDPASAALALSSASAGTGPPQYPWRTLFLGAHVRGERCGPGTYHGPQGSEATEAVVCGSWPRSSSSTATADGPSTQALANVVLLPPTTTCGTGVGTSSFFFTLQNTRWAEEEHEGEGGNGTFPTATLRQSPAALSGMWEPLLRAVDDALSRPAPPLSFTADGAAASRDATWRHARQVMDHLAYSPACVDALHTFRACFACMYGYDTAGGAASAEMKDGGDEERRFSLRSSSSSRGGGVREEEEAPPMPSAQSFLARLRTAAALPSPESFLGYPWCPTHSWCAFAHLHPHTSDGDAPSSTFFNACLHEPLSSGATHQRPTSKSSSKHNNTRGASRRPPLSAVAEALEQHAAVHTFTHAMHTAAAMVSSLRLRLLSCCAVYPDLCEVVMTQDASGDGVLAYCWDLVYDYVGAILYERAAAVAVADVRMVWDLVGLDQLQVDGAVVHTRPGWQAEGKETLCDYAVALRRCRALQRTDVVDTLPWASASASAGGGGDNNDDADLQECLRLLEVCLRAPAWTAGGQTEHRSEHSGLDSIVAALQQLHTLLGDSENASVEAAGDVEEFASVSPALGGADVTALGKRLASSRREGLLRWLLIAASDPAFHLAGPAPPLGRRPASSSLGHPFALLLIASYVLGGRVTPQYPTEAHTFAARSVDAAALLGLLKEIGCASRQVLHTYPVLRAQSFAHPLVCPLDVLVVKLEYALSPCAAHSLLSSASPSPSPSSTPQWLLAALAASTSDANQGGTTGVHTTVQLDQLPVEVLQWCNAALTDAVTENTLQARLHRYWRHPAASLTPSPLVRWVLTCLQGLLSEPIRRSAPRGSDTQPAAAAPTVVGGVYAWKRFITAAFYTAEERREGGGGVDGVGASSPPGSAYPLTAEDFAYLLALAYTLREVSGIDLVFTAHVVLQDDDDDEGGGVEGQSIPVPHSHSHASAAESPRDRKRNIFLDTSSSSSLEPSVSVSPNSSPPAEPQDGWAAGDDGSDGTAPPAVNATPTDQTPLPLGSSPGLPQRTPVAAQTSPRSEGHRQQRRHSTRRGASALLVDGAAVPLGKEWTLTLRLPTEANTGDAQKTRGGGVLPTLLWEVMERVCARVEYRVQAQKPVVAAVEGETHLLKDLSK